MSQILEGKVVIVTGSGRGVGEYIAKEAAAQGARVVVNDLGKNEEGQNTAEVVCAQIKEAGGEAIASLDSVAEWSGAEKMIQAAMDNWGRVDGIVNNAGILRDKIFHKMSEEEWDQSFEVNVKGCFNTSRVAAPIFKAQESGSLVHMTSTSGLIGNFGQANYSAGKMGLVGLSKSIALDMQRFGVRSNCIAPFAMTPMVMAGIPRETEEDKARWRVIERMAPEKIAPLACALMSDDAKDVTGQIFGSRANEVYLFSQPRPMRTMHIGDEEGISTQAVIDRVLPAFRTSMYNLDRSMDVFTWDPV
jgi:NAD(P)-dependent dehydrogenase (short-subunit alcohol dehydrogenase family)